MLVYFVAVWNILHTFGMFHGHVYVWCVSWPFGMFNGHLECFMAIWYTFARFGKLYQEKSGNPARYRPKCHLV
jgi:hypothetical protein